MEEKFEKTGGIRLIIQNVMGAEMKGDWEKRLAQIGQMDYSLGAFRKIAAHLLKQAEAELTPGSFVRSGYLYTRKNQQPVDWVNVDVSRYNAQFIIEGFAVVLAGLLSSISELLPEAGSYNVEFQNVLERLTDSKCAKLLYLDGPFRAGETRAAVTEALMLYSMK
jgi:hypothetical protein